ncbi:MAG: efflux RND transporter permease subunit [Myxococcota bacterium]|nr:efflux RND transporter permease subunit [Myxococcota bacterium]
MSSWTRWCLRSPRVATACLLLATIAFAAGIPRVRSEAGYRAFLGPDHPAIERLDALTERFGGGLPFAAVFSCVESTACDSALDPVSLAMAYDVARKLEAVPGVTRVDGPATSPLLVQPALGLPEARFLAPDGEPARDLAALARRAVKDATWVGQILSADARAGALVISLESSDPDLGVRALETLRSALRPAEARGFVFHLVGGPVEFVVAGGELERATAQMVPVMVALAGLVLALLFRRPAPALASLLGVGVAVVWTQGALGWFGFAQNSLTQVLPPLVLVIGVCDTIHLLTAYTARVGDDADRAGREDALVAAARAVGRPCLFTTLTTVAGFLSFLASDLESFARFGVIAAFGVSAALVASFSAVPLLVAAVPARWIRWAEGEARFAAVLGRVATLSPRAALGIVGTAVVVAGLGGVGMARLEVDARFEDLYGEQSQVVQWVRGAARHLREAETLEIALELPEGVGVDDARALAVLSRLEPLAEVPGLGASLSILDPMRDLNRMLHGDELRFDDGLDPRRPGQLFRLLRAQAPGFTALLADGEGGALRLSLQAGKSPMERLREILREVDTHLERELPEGYRAVVTGPLATVTVMIEDIRATQLSSFAVAAGLILLLVMVFFRSATIGALALVPTALPVIGTLGAMGWLGLALDVGSAMVAAVVLGLAVDDAIHLLDAVDRRRKDGETLEQALGHAVGDVGRALVTTSLALTVGFTALSLSPWNTVASFGQVTAIAILGALASVLLVLPALLKVGAGPGRRSEAPPRP